MRLPGRGVLTRAFSAKPANPATGEYTTYSTDGKSLDMVDATGAVTRIGPSAATGSSSGALVDGGSPTTNHVGNLTVDFGSVT